MNEAVDKTISTIDRYAATKLLMSSLIMERDEARKENAILKAKLAALEAPPSAEFIAKRKYLLEQTHKYFTQREQGVKAPDPSADKLIDLIIEIAL